MAANAMRNFMMILLGEVCEEMCWLNRKFQIVLMKLSRKIRLFIPVSGGERISFTTTFEAPKAQQQIAQFHNWKKSAWTQKTTLSCHAGCVYLHVNEEDGQNVRNKVTCVALL